MKRDVQIQRDVLDELDWEASVDASQIGVTVKEGVVTLTGHVPVFSEKHTAEQVAKRVHGVRAIANDIEVRPGDTHQRDDTELAAAASHAITWDAGVPEERVQVTVSDGWITLAGTVDWQFQKMAAYRAVQHLMGARGVTNTIEVRPQPATQEEQTERKRAEPHMATRAGRHQMEVLPERTVERMEPAVSTRSAVTLPTIVASVEAALRRNAALRSRTISVDTEEGVVVLTGDVHSLAELEEAERTAWSAQGVCEVQNCITITPWGHGPSEEWGY